MKNVCYILIFIFSLGACTIQKKTTTGIDIRNQDDSTEYELIIFDPGFETWFISHSRPVWYHSKEYYETWNRQYVSEWNNKAISPRYARYFESTINWDHSVDYGLEVNHKLFWYFQYVEKVLKIDILPSGMGPKAIL